MLVAGGYAAVFPQRYLGDPELAGIWHMVEEMVRNHAPFPALALDQRWRIVASNDVLRRLIRSVDPALLSTPINWARVAAQVVDSYNNDDGGSATSTAFSFSSR